MSRFADLRVGSRVRQGQIVGYVGTTGRSTGPHLHYEVLVDGSQINPLSVKLPSGRALAGKELKQFQGIMQDLDRKMRTLPEPAQLAQAKEAEPPTTE
jgi:murein DD-endopeptidase MepM/ murein hydrolase activator NlpD